MKCAMSTKAILEIRAIKNARIVIKILKINQFVGNVR